MGDQEISEDLHSDEQSADWRFSFTDIYNYLRYQQYLKEHQSWRKTRCEGDPSISSHAAK